MGVTEDNPLTIPEYDSALFVNREKEIELVKEKALALSIGNDVRERTIVFLGYKGTGRTWLLKRLQEVLSSLKGVCAQYLDLDKWANCSDLALAVKEFWTCIADGARKSLGRSGINLDGDKSTAADSSGQLPADIQDLLGNYVMVLLVDHVYESDWDLLERLEDQILAPLAVNPRVLLVMAGRGQAYIWKAPELRLYTEEHRLQPFDEDLTKAQLEKQKPDAVSRTPEIHEMSQGYPLGNYLLATRPTVTEAMQETVDGLLYRVPPQERSWIEALCVLRAFDEERIPVLLAAYLNDPSILQWPYKEVRQVRDRLLQTALVRWEEKAGGWAVDEAIRPVVEKYLQQTKPDAWRQLHCEAYRLYKNWEQQYPDEKQRWQSEASYHAKCLSNAGPNLDQCL